MTISSENRRAGPYLGNDVATSFAFAFKVFATSDLQVVHTDMAGAESALALTTDYTVGLNSNQDSNPGGTVTLSAALASGTKLTITSNIPPLQATDLTNQGGFYPKVITSALDKLTILIQQALNGIGRSIKVPISDSAANATLPSASVRAGKALGFDANGQPIAVPAGSAVTDSGAVTFAQGSAYSAGTIGAWLNAMYGSAGASMVGYTQGGAGASGRTVQDKLREVVSVFDFMSPAEIAAVRNNTALDVTTAVQAAIDYIVTVRNGKLVFPAGDYRVTQITLKGNGLTYEFNNAVIAGIASTAKTSIVQIKCGWSSIKNLRVGGNQNTNYACGVHWYTNDLNTYYPGRNRIDGLYVAECKIGVVVGALPSQVSIAAQGTVQADGTATDAPLSETYIHGLQTYGCVRGFYLRQPNGKLVLSCPDVTGEDNVWASYADRTETVAVMIEDPGSELTIIGGDIEQIQQMDGALIRAYGGTLNVIGSVLESVCPIEIASGAVVRMSNILNWGLNNTATNFFRIMNSASGSLDLSDMFLLRGYGYATAQSVFKTVSSFSSAAFSPNPYFWINCSQVRFGDPNFTQGGTYNPIVAGCRSKFANCWITNYNGGGTRLSQYKVDEGQNLLSGKVDLSADSITAYGANASATAGGWAFTNASGSSWGRDSSSLPTIEGVTPNYALRLTAASGGATVYGVSPKFAVEPQRFYLLKGWMKTSGSGSQNILRVNWYKFGGGAASTTSTDALSGAAGAAGAAGTTWSPFMVWVQAPKDAVQAEVFVYAEGSADLCLVNMEIV